MLPAVTSTNRVGVAVHADKFSKTRSHSEIAGRSFVVFGSTRNGMGVGPVLPQMLDLAGRSADTPEKARV